MNYADIYLMTNTNYFPAESIPMLHEELSHLDEQSTHVLLMTELKNPTTALLLGVFIGECGVDRFYIKQSSLGAIKAGLTVIGILTAWMLIGFLFLGAVYIWKMIDLFLIMEACRQGNLERLLVNIQQVKKRANDQKTEPVTNAENLVEATTTSVETMVEVTEEVVDSAAVERDEASVVQERMPVPAIEATSDTEVTSDAQSATVQTAPVDE